MRGWGVKLKPSTIFYMPPKSSNYNPLETRTHFVLVNNTNPLFKSLK